MNIGRIERASPDGRVQTVFGTAHNDLQIVDSKAQEWPEQMAQEAYRGLAGDFVRLVAPQTEADPQALLANFLVGSGVLFRREGWAEADGRKHYGNEFILLAGATSAGRKGTASARTIPIMEQVDPSFSNRVVKGLSSGEGLIKAVSLTDENLQPGEVRSYLALLPEFGSLLNVMKREGNTMSAILREAWDGDRLRVLTRKEPLDADDVNLSVIAHITPEELLNNLTATDKANGFANRFLLLLVRRSKFLPEGGDQVDLNPIVRRLRDAAEYAKGRGRLERDGPARELWRAEYERLTAARRGLSGALCGRAEAHILRLSLLYALLDSASVIRREHLESAIAFWDYCERSVNHLFGGISGDANKEKILEALTSGPMSMTELRRLFSNNRDADWINAKMANLMRAGTVVKVTKKGERREAVVAWDLATRHTHNCA